MVELITNRTVPGKYDYKDFNRVGQAVQSLYDRMKWAGIKVEPVTPKTNWSRSDRWTPENTQEYLFNVFKVCSPLTEIPFDFPKTMQYLTYEGANVIERTLMNADAALTKQLAAKAAENPKNRKEKNNERNFDPSDP